MKRGRKRDQTRGRGGMIMMNMRNVEVSEEDAADRVKQIQPQIMGRKSEENNTIYKNTQ